MTSVSNPSGFPRRVVCLTDETTETLYLLGEQDRIVGISAYARRPPEVRSKPRVCAFSNANFDAIVRLEPDLVLTFSDVQAEITRELVLRGVNVMNFNQRSTGEILDMIALLARIVGKPDQGIQLIDSLQHGLDAIRNSASRFPHRPRVYFEEWNDPLISGIRWVEELIEIAGGDPIFPELKNCGKARDRVINPAAVIGRDPEVILASWCGMRVKKEQIVTREGWNSIAAVQNNHIYEIPGTCILQPGPASLTDGVRQLHAVLAHVLQVGIAPELKPVENFEALETALL